jgi:dephospho-CoA kinase
MLVLGLTGSIGMGKSATADMFRLEGVPVYDADASVHALYAEGGAAVAPVEAAFPGVAKNGAIDRELLRAKVVGDADAMKTLEGIVHPLTAAAQRRFRSQAVQDGVDFVVLDVPLLYETGGHLSCDFVLVVTAPAQVQAARVLAREGMTAELLESILARQMPDAEKRARADFILSTAHGFDYARDQVAALCRLMRHIASGEHA